MSFGQAIKSVLSQYATFTGRARRAEYWWFYLFFTLVSLPFQIFFFAMYLAAFAPAFEGLDADGQYSEVAFDDINWGLFAVGFVPMIIVTLAFLVPSLAVLVRRLHDTGRSGWWWLISFVPFGSIAILVFTVLDGQPHDNEYGPDPKAGERRSGSGYGGPRQYAQPAPPPPYSPPPAPDFPPPGPIAQPPSPPPANPDDPFAAPGR
ncbi:MAG: DUF805 domain-containing protein [Demequina sp.]|nr:DUF805 domain-containing protein [Demequina sp.]